MNLIPIHCRDCSRPHAATPEAARKHTRCPFCGGRLQVARHAFITASALRFVRRRENANV